MAYNVFNLLGACSPKMVAMVYNWKTFQWTEYTEVAAVLDVSRTLEMTCAKLIHNDEAKIYIMMHRYMDHSK